MKFLLDTCIISELINPAGNPVVQKTIKPIEGQRLFISAVTIGEITRGIFLLPHSRKRKNLAEWLLKIEEQFERRILNFDRDTAIMWGELSASTKLKGKTVPIIDGIIAATALQHGLHIMTRNVKDFEHTGALIVNPFDQVD